MDAVREKKGKLDIPFENDTFVIAEEFKDLFRSLVAAYTRCAGKKQREKNRLADNELIQQWEKRIKELSALKNVYAKLSWKEKQAIVEEYTPELHKIMAVEKSMDANLTDEDIRSITGKV